jgi:deoxyribose-phosphate aldolase
MSSPVLSVDTLLDSCRQARRYRVGTIKVSPYYAQETSDALRDSGVRVCAMLGDTDGLMSPDAKLADAGRSLRAGVGALVFPLNAMAVKSGRMADTREDLSRIVHAAAGKAEVSVSMDTAHFDDEELMKIFSLIKGSGADYVELHGRTAGSGMDMAGTYLGKQVGIKVAGDFRTLAGVREMIGAGAVGIGTPDALTIIREIERRTLVG